MPPTAASGSKSASIDFRKSLLKTFAINQITMLARQVGHAVAAQTGFGLWEWGSLWRECGFGK